MHDLSVYELKKAGKRLREFIDMHFTSYADFAQMVGVRPCTVTHWMSGKGPVSLSSIDKLLILFPEDFPLNIIRPDYRKAVDRLK